MQNTAGNSASSQDQTASNSVEYANDWIEFLKRRNRSLNAVWISLLIIAIGLSVVAGMQFLKGNELASTLERAHTVNQQLQLELDTRQQQLDEANIRVKDTAAKLSLVQQENETFKGETSSQQILSQQLVATLEEKIDILEQENSLVAASLEDSKGQHLQASRAERQYKAEVQALIKEVSSRKLAYQALVKRQRETQGEIERLANELDDTIERERSLDQRNAELSERVKALAQQSEDYKARYTVLEKQLKAITSPIGGGGKTSIRKQTAPQSSTQATPKAVPKTTPNIHPKASSTTKTAETERALQESRSQQSTPLQRPAASEQAGAPPKKVSSPLDFDSIAID